MAERSDIIIVSGLPRSGTSMMMRMVQAAGVPVLTDQVRTADTDNPNGYFEYEPVKKTAQDPSWVPLARGRVVKMVHLLLRDLPETERYRVILMHRDLDEVLASQRTMLARNGRPGAQIPPEALKGVFRTQLEAVGRWLDARPCFAHLDVQYRDVLNDPLAQSERISGFLELPGTSQAMAAAVDPALYRNRGGEARS